MLSSDNVLFRVHSANVKTHTTVFPLDEISHIGQLEPTRCTEESAVLEVLFSHLYPEAEIADSDLDKAGSFALMMKVAHAARKYGIVAAIRVYDLRMLCVVSSSLYSQLRLDML